MEKRREQVLETARRLFGERGYNEVSMRDIANELGISVGNVTYYFKKKEDLVEASVLEQSQTYHLPPTPSSLAELNQMFSYISVEIQNKMYYFHHYDQMAQLSRRVYELQLNYKKDLYLTLNKCFANLQQGGDMEPEVFPGQTEYFVHGLMTAMTYWTPHEIGISGPDSDSHEFMMCIWSLMFPCLTSKGKEFCQKKILPKLERV